MNANRTFFYKLHTGTLLCLMLAVSSVTAFCVHPFVSVLACVLGTLSFLCYGKAKEWRALCRFCLPIAVCILLFNVLFNRNGATVLFYIGDDPVLLESFLFAFFSALSFCAVTFWFSFFCLFLDADRIFLFFGGISKNFALLFSLSMALVPKTLAKYAEIKAQAKETEDKRKKLTNLVLHLATLLSWVLEDSFETAVSMKARGALLKKKRKTSKRNFSFWNTLLSVFSLMMLLAPFVFAPLKRSIYPIFQLDAYFQNAFLPYSLLMILYSLPLIFKGGEELKWKSIEQKN